MEMENETCEGGAHSTMICYKNFCKYHNVPPVIIIKKKKKARSWWLTLAILAT
jgi:hypothetical protein